MTGEEKGKEDAQRREGGQAPRGSMPKERGEYEDSTGAKTVTRKPDEGEGGAQKCERSREHKRREGLAAATKKESRENERVCSEQEAKYSEGYTGSGKEAKKAKESRQRNPDSSWRQTETKGTESRECGQ